MIYFKIFKNFNDELYLHNTKTIVSYKGKTKFRYQKSLNKTSGRVENGNKYVIGRSKLYSYNFAY